MDTELIIQYLKKHYPEVVASPRDSIETVMFNSGKRTVVKDIFRFLGRDEEGKYVDGK